MRVISGSSARSVAMTQSAAPAQYRTARRSGSYPIRFDGRPAVRAVDAAELLEALRIQHERRRAVRRPPACRGIAERARAEAVHDVESGPAAAMAAAARPAR